MTSKATEARRKRETINQQVLSLSLYTNHLERRIINLESKLQIKHNLVKKEFLTNRQIKVYFEFLLNTVCSYYNTTIPSLFRKNRSEEVVKARRIIIYIMKEIYNINEADIVKVLLKEINFKIDRSTIYHHVCVVEDAKRTNDNSLNLLGELEEIISKLTSK